MGGKGSKLVKLGVNPRSRTKSVDFETGGDCLERGRELTMCIPARASSAPFGCFTIMSLPAAVSSKGTNRALGLQHHSRLELESSSELIPGIALDELAMLCLARVPLNTVPLMRGVCKKWQNVVDSGELFQVRKEEGVAEGWLCAVEWGALGSQEMFAHLWAFDPLSARWNNLGHLPLKQKITPGSRMVAIGTTLIFLGGASPPDEFDRFLPTGEVWKYDLLKRKVIRACPMITPRDRFASAVIGGKLYIAGGLGAGFNYAHESLHSAEVYDPELDTWQSLPDMPVSQNQMATLECQGATIHGKFFVRSSWNRALADVFDPLTGKWTSNPTFFPPDSNAPFYTRLESGEKCMYMLDTVPRPTSSRTNELRAFDREKNEWEQVAQLPVEGFVGAVSVAGIGEKVYLVGGEDPRSDPHEAWAARLPFNGRLGKLMAEPCMHVYDRQSGEDKWQAMNPPQHGVVTRWLGTCTVVKV